MSRRHGQADLTATIAIKIRVRFQPRPLSRPWKHADTAIRRVRHALSCVEEPIMMAIGRARMR